MTDFFRPSPELTQNNSAAEGFERVLGKMRGRDGAGPPMGFSMDDES